MPVLVASSRLTVHVALHLQVVRPRPASATSIPGLLALMQNEWDDLMLETYTLRYSRRTAGLYFVLCIACLHDLTYCCSVVCAVHSAISRNRSNQMHSLVNSRHHYWVAFALFQFGHISCSCHIAQLCTLQQATPGNNSPRAESGILPG
jgi:Prp19/Pso4-like